jgi:hypothetical protein
MAMECPTDVKALRAALMTLVEAGEEWSDGVPKGGPRKQYEMYYTVAMARRMEAALAKARAVLGHVPNWL